MGSMIDLNQGYNHVGQIMSSGYYLEIRTTSRVPIDLGKGLPITQQWMALDPTSGIQDFIDNDVLFKNFFAISLDEALHHRDMMIHLIRRLGFADKGIELRIVEVDIRLSYETREIGVSQSICVRSNDIPEFNSVPRGDGI